MLDDWVFCTHIGDKGNNTEVGKPIICGTEMQWAGSCVVVGGMSVRARVGE